MSHTNGNTPRNRIAGAEAMVEGFDALLAAQRVQSELDWERALASFEKAIGHLHIVQNFTDHLLRDYMLGKAVDNVTNRRALLRHATREYARLHGGAL